MEGLILIRELTNKDSKKKEQDFFKEITKDIDKMPLENWHYEVKSSKHDGSTYYGENASAKFERGLIAFMSEGFAYGLDNKYKDVESKKYSMTFLYGNEAGDKYTFKESFFKENLRAQKSVSRLLSKLYYKNEEDIKKEISRKAINVQG